jgi:Lipocalin-like domain
LNIGELVGTWSLIDWRRESAGRALDEPLGSEPIGLISYDPTGYMQVQMMGRNRRMVLFQNSRDAANADLRGQTINLEAGQEVAAVYASFAAYAGRFEVDETASIIYHHIVTCLDPNMVGKTVTRRAQILTGSVLVLSTLPYRAKDMEITGVLRWRRAT